MNQEIRQKSHVSVPLKMQSMQDDSVGHFPVTISWISGNILFYFGNPKRL
jgi:hypothetical protein